MRDLLALNWPGYRQAVHSYIHIADDIWSENNHW